MKKYFSIVAVCILFMATSCKKDKNQIFISEFNGQEDLDQWIISGDGDATIDNGSVSFTNIQSCFHLEVKELIDVSKDQSYKIKIRSKHNPSQIGDPAYCVGNMMIWVKQDSETLMMDGTTSGDDFIEQQFTFTTITGSPIQIEFLIGTINGAWIDFISVEKV